MKKASSSDKHSSIQSPLEEAIRRRAYELYELRGRVDGLDVQDWTQAEAEIAGSKRLAKAKAAS